MRPTRGNANYMNYHFTQNMVLLETISRIITFITTTFEYKENKTGGDNSRSCQATVMPNVFHFGVFWLPTVSAISYPGFLFPLFSRLEANASRKFWTVRTKISDFCLKCACLDFMQRHVEIPVTSDHFYCLKKPIEIVKLINLLIVARFLKRA